MTLYLQLNGTSDDIVTPSITFNQIVLDLYAKENDTGVQYIYHVSSGSAYLYSGGDPDWFVGSLKIDGVQITNGSSFIVPNRALYDSKIGSSTITESIYFFRRSTGIQRMPADIFSIKIYNNNNLVAHYDMSTGTVQDQSGNGNHATLTGGTWLDDGTGVPTGEDGSVSVDTEQVMYQDGSTSSETKQVIYQISSISFDMRFLLYFDGSILHDSRQAIYESGQNDFDLKQAIYETGAGKADIHLVLFVDSFSHHDLIQSLYEDAAVHFDTKQTLFDTNKQVIGVIRLKGNLELYVYLLGRQDLIVPLKGKQDLLINLKGDVNVTVDNGMFKMYAGDSKYLPITVEGVTDFSGSTAKWALMQSVYSSEHTLLKTIGDGISITDGKLQVKLDSVDTKNLLGKFYFETELTDALGNVSTVAIGEIEIKKSGV